MPVTNEPPGLQWINNVNMATFGSLVSQVCWFLGSVALTFAACFLLLTPDGPSLDHGIPTDHQTHRNLGFQLAAILLTAWTGKTVAGVVDSNNKRKSHPAYADVLKAQTEGKVVGAGMVSNAAAAAAARAAAATAASVAAATATTQEHPALHADNVEGDVNIEAAPASERPARPKNGLPKSLGFAASPPPPPDTEPTWADGREPHAGIL